ncbi:hypothetical protein SKAU_G00221860 [Synaphobranchus kaupii]|uniref:Uncharacterized protein n=1 Tax=Synaphobranchus kaupii TaxID=118154 RepID=A0A9Q1IVK5_SYNKA|nr:hypothetical protein SKAU_G00221860 [Synaphobranchus kaupii]
MKIGFRTSLSVDAPVACGRRWLFGTWLDVGSRVTPPAGHCGQVAPPARPPLCLSGQLSAGDSNGVPLPQRGQGTRTVQLPPRALSLDVLAANGQGADIAAARTRRQVPAIKGSATRSSDVSRANTGAGGARGAALLESGGLQSSCPLRGGFGFGRPE